MPDISEQDIDVETNGVLEGHAGITCAHQGNAAKDLEAIGMILQIEASVSSLWAALQEIEGRW